MAVILCKDLNLNSPFSGRRAKRRNCVRGLIFTANLDTAPCTKSLNHRSWLFWEYFPSSQRKGDKLIYVFFWLRPINWVVRSSYVFFRSVMYFVLRNFKVLMELIRL